MALVDWKRNNKVALRNFSEGCDLHDVVKTLLVRMIRRKHTDNNKCQIYTEYNTEEPNESYPDIEVHLKEKWKGPSKRIIYEIQDKVSKEWTDKIVSRYEGCDVIIVPLKAMEGINLSTLKSKLQTYVI